TTEERWQTRAEPALGAPVERQGQGAAAGCSHLKACRWARWVATLWPAHSPSHSPSLPGPQVMILIFFLGQKQKISNPPDFRGKRIQVDESGAIPRMQHCYHIEYFLLPDDLVPRKLDFVVFGVVAKLFTESKGRKIVDIIVANEYLIKLRDHKTLKIWDTKDKVSSKAKRTWGLRAHKSSRSQEQMNEKLMPFKINIECENSEKHPRSLAFQLGYQGEKLVISCLAENGPEILDAYMTFTVETPLLSERQRHELTPPTIRITLATCLPNTPVPTEVLQKLCLPTYCTYKFHNFSPHRTHGQLHGTHVCFKDVNVLLTGTMKPGELQRYLQGPPLETEVHDHDRNTENNTKKPSLFGEGAADEKVGKESFLTCKSTACNSYTVNKVWHPHGVAKVSLTDLLLGKKCLTISASIHNCSAPRTAAFSEEDEKEKIAESVSHSSLLPMGHYLEPGSLLKVRVETAVPLGMHGEIADAQVANCPYGSIIYIFDYNNPSLLHDLVEEVTEINAKALRLDCYPVHLIGMALAALKLKTTLEKILELDIVTGFHLLDGATHLFVLEGLKDKAIQKLWDKHFERTHRREGGQLEILYNSQLSFHQRLYADRGAIFRHFCLCQPLFTLTKQPLPYVRGELPRACFQALSRHDLLCYLCHSKRLRDVTPGDLLPSAAMITALSRQYGVPLTDEDLFTRKPPLLSFSSDDYTAPGKVSRGNQAVHSSFDNHNEVCAQRKKEIAGKMTSERNPPKGKVEKAKPETFRIVPVDGKSVFNYSAQSLNSAELAKRHLRQEMVKEPDNRFTYCQEYLSATFDPVDVVAACKEFLAKSRSVWLSPDGFVFPGFKGSIESHLHPWMPDEKWQENALHANVEPVLARDRWSWDKRRIDFDLYKKPPELFVTTAPQTGDGAVKIN
uniref:Cilia and flagella associated protein 92 (putative) n=1 Tax=Falco tinnunculus TaxID=100819 RepID=A0A8C4U6V5_FALTI